MKKYIGFIAIAVVTAAIVLLTRFHIGTGNIAIIGGMIILIIFVAAFETQGNDAKSMALVATLAALGGAVRVPFAGIPGLQPTTFITALSGFVMGPVNGFMVGALSAFISNFFLGQGPWTLWQMLGWGACGLFFGLIRNRKKYKLGKLSMVLFVVLCGLWAYGYGAILNMWYVVAYIKPITFKSIAASLVLSFPQDTIHMIGNVFFSAVFGKRFITVLQRYNKRFTTEYINEI